MELSDGIDLAAYATISAQSYTMELVSTQVLKNAMDMMEMQGAEIVQMMEQSVNPAVGRNIDIRV